MARRAIRLEFSPHWFRRAMHAGASAYLLYYLLPEGPGPLGATRRHLAVAVLLVLVLVDALRMVGVLQSEGFFGLREYERTRVSGYVYFAAAATALLLFFPQALAIPCLVAASLGDPLMGELRRMARPRASLVAGFALASVVFAVAGFAPAGVLLGGGLAVAGERLAWRALDDDLLMPMLPAIVLAALAAAGLVPIPGPSIEAWGGAAP